MSLKDFLNKTSASSSVDKDDDKININNSTWSPAHLLIPLKGIIREEF